MDLEFDYEELDLQAIDAIEQDYLQRRAAGTEQEACSLDDEAFEAAAIAAVDEAEARTRKNGSEYGHGVNREEGQRGRTKPLQENSGLPRPSQEGKQKTLDCFWTCSARSSEERPQDGKRGKEMDRNVFRHSKTTANRGEGLYSSVFRREREKQKCLVPVDREAALTWVYPSHPSIREYQYTMVQTSLFDNTLVCLPTGLGKTLIAAVVMYNYYRWFPRGKILFMAPTRPLVSQQIEACWKIMGISKDDAVELTGQTKAMERAELWETKRVFYLTPQVLENDLRQQICPAHKVVCMVLDEAHRAQGNYAYVSSTKLLQDSGACFRVLALSATPGGSFSEIQSVITNLSIAKVEFRSEEDPDVSKYCFRRSVRVVEVRPSDHLCNARDVLLDGLLRPVVKKLVNCGVYYKTNVESIGRFSYLQAQKAFRANPPESLHQSRYAEVELRFQQALRLASVYEQLEKYGIETALQAIEEGVKGPLGRLYREEPCFRQLKAMLQGLIKGEIVHPKIECLQNILHDHFHKRDQEKVAGRVIVFTNLRDSVLAICNAVNGMTPSVKAEQFIGQGVGGKLGKKGQTQKEQKDILGRFRKSEFQVLVATSIGEEGLDIPDVDLIVCFDSSASPTRHIQRMGRTGRFRHGAVVVICAQGKERQDYEANLERTRKLHRQLRRGGQSFSLCAHASPFMLPGDPTPIVIDLSIAQKLGIKHAQKNPVAVSENRNLEFDRAAHISFLRPTSAVERSALKRSGGWKDEHNIPSMLAWPSFQSSFSPIAGVLHSSRTKEFVRIMATISTSLRRSDRTGIADARVDLPRTPHAGVAASPGQDDVGEASAARHRTKELEPARVAHTQCLHASWHTDGVVSEEEKTCPTPALQLECDSLSREAEQVSAKACKPSQPPESGSMPARSLSTAQSDEHVDVLSKAEEVDVTGKHTPQVGFEKSTCISSSFWGNIAGSQPSNVPQDSPAGVHTLEMPPPPPRLSPKVRVAMHTNGRETMHLDPQCGPSSTMHIFEEAPEEIAHPGFMHEDRIYAEGRGQNPQMPLYSSAHTGQEVSKATKLSPLSDDKKPVQAAENSGGKSAGSAQAHAGGKDCHVAPSDRSPMSRLEDSISSPVNYKTPIKSLKRLRKAIDLERRPEPHAEQASTCKPRKRQRNNRSMFIDDTADASSDDAEDEDDLDQDISGLIDDRSISQYTQSEMMGGSSSGVGKGNQQDMMAVYRRTLQNSSPLGPRQEAGRRSSIPAFRSPPRLHPNRGFAKMGCSEAVPEGAVDQYHSRGNCSASFEAANGPENSRDTSQHLDYCAACLGDGELILCDGCPAAYHFHCVGLNQLPAGRWFCIHCSRDKLGQ